MHVVTVSAAATQQKRHNAIVQLFFLWFNEQNHKILGYANIDGTFFLGNILKIIVHSTTVLYMTFDYLIYSVVVNKML